MIKCPVCGDEFSSPQSRGGHFRCHEGSLIKECLVDVIRDVYDDIDRVPRSYDMDEHSTYSSSIFTRRFESWNDALKEAGFDPVVQRNIPREELVEEIKRVHGDIGKVPTASDVNEMSDFSTRPYRNEFGSWNNALKEAGFDPVVQRNIPRKELVEEIKRVHGNIGRVPMQQDMIEMSKFSVSTYHERFGSWNDAIKEAGFEPEYRVYIPREELIDEIKRVHGNLGRVPNKRDMKEMSDFSTQPYRKEFGTWTNALKEAGFDLDDRKPVKTVWDSDVDDYYGRSWNDSRKEALERDDHECRVCGSQKRLSVHHIKPRRLFEDPDNSNTEDNLITLCSPCHGTFEAMWMDCNHLEFEEKAKNAYNN